MKKIIISLMILISSCNSTLSQDKFNSSYNYYTTTLTDKTVVLEDFSKFINISNPKTPSRYTFVVPQAIDSWGYSEMAISYVLTEKEINSTLDKLLDVSKFNQKLKTKNLGERLINKNMMNTLEDINAVIPQFQYNTFYSENISIQNCEIFVLDYGIGNIFDKKYLTEKQNAIQDNEHGFSIGVLVDRKTHQIIYWLLAW